MNDYASNAGMNYVEDMKSIMGMINRGDHDAAVQKCQALVRARIDAGLASPDVYYLLGVVNHLQKNTQNACENIASALRMIGKTPAFEFESPEINLFGFNSSREIFDYYNMIRSASAGGIQVFYTEDLDGGGDSIGQDFKIFLSERYVRRGRLFDRAYEGFCGAGFIGFSLLGHGICRTLCLSDINRKAVNACNETIRRNDLFGQATTYLSDCLDSIPAGERWDLVVANPPHIPSRLPHKNRELTYLDEGFKLHRRFFEKLGEHVTDDAVILFQESARHSSLSDFEPMITGNGFRVVQTMPCRSARQYYYILIERA